MALGRGGSVIKGGINIKSCKATHPQLFSNKFALSAGLRALIFFVINRNFLLKHIQHNVFYIVTNTINDYIFNRTLVRKYPVDCIYQKPYEKMPQMTVYLTGTS